MDFDKVFIQKIKEQDHLAFNEFYLKTVDIFFRYIKIHYFISDEDSNDIIASFYVKVRESLKKFDPEKGFSAYIWTIFKNNIKDYFKKMSDLPFSVLDNDDESFSFEDTLKDNLNLTELLEQNFKFENIQKAMLKLDDTSKDIIHFKFIEEKSYQEISNIMQLSQDNLRQKMSRAIKQLKMLLSTG